MRQVFISTGDGELNRSLERDLRNFLQVHVISAGQVGQIGDGDVVITNSWNGINKLTEAAGKAGAAVLALACDTTDAKKLRARRDVNSVLPPEEARIPQKIIDAALELLPEHRAK